MPTVSYPRLMPAGDTGLVVELGDAIEAAIHDRVLALDRLVAAAAIAGVVETLPTYRSLFVAYEPLVIDHRALIAAIEALLANLPAAPPVSLGRSWRIPIVYGGEFGIDLTAIAAHCGLSEAAVIARHAEADYRVYMIGFQPGYAYLGGLEPTLGMSRLATPRLVVPAGSVAIGGVQSCINSVAAPSGWRLLGRTPERLFDPARADPFLLAAGDRVRFEALPQAAWAPLSRRVAAGERVAALLP